MGEKLRLRLVESAIRESLERLSKINMQGILGEIVGSESGDELAGFFKDIGKTAQGMRFLQLCYREDDIEKWRCFMEHECCKAESKWGGNKVVKTFMENLKQWWEKYAGENYLTDSLLSTRLKGMPRELQPNIEEYRRWRLLVLRRILRNTIKGQMDLYEDTLL